MLTQGLTPSLDQQKRPKIRLVMVTAENNNKYYEMEENEDATFSVRYGRVGAMGSQRTYSMAQWRQKYSEKVRKGYRDVSQVLAEKRSALSLKISDCSIRRLIEQLTQYAKSEIDAQYLVSADDVSAQQVEEAQTILDDLVEKVSAKTKLKSFNQQLTLLYTIIPRKMTNVRNYLATSLSDSDARQSVYLLLSKEQETLDVMAGQVKLNENKGEEKTAKQTLKEAYGIEMKPVMDEQITTLITRMMGEKQDSFKRAWEVTNVGRRAAYTQTISAVSNKKSRLLWHGSRNANWLSILETGLQLKPASAIVNGKMFGYGLYFADKFQKSLNYSSLSGSYWAGGTANSGYLALYDVHLGNHLKIKEHHAWCYDLNEKQLANRGKKDKAKYDTVFAEGGVDLVNNEYIVYNQNQCTIRYLIEVGS